TRSDLSQSPLRSPLRDGPRRQQTLRRKRRPGEFQRKMEERQGDGKARGQGAGETRKLRDRQTKCHRFARSCGSLPKSPRSRAINHRRRRMIFGVSQIVTIRKIATMTSITPGKKAVRIADPNATTSSVKLNATFETGSGLVFAANLAAAFVPCEPSA